MYVRGDVAVSLLNNSVYMWGKVCTTHANCTIVTTPELKSTNVSQIYSIFYTSMFHTI